MTSLYVIALVIIKWWNGLIRCSVYFWTPCHERFGNFNKITYFNMRNMTKPLENRLKKKKRLSGRVLDNDWVKYFNFTIMNYICNDNDDEISFSPWNKVITLTRRELIQLRKQITQCFSAPQRFARIIALCFVTVFSIALTHLRFLNFKRRS